jgi:hypothetical protein
VSRSTPMNAQQPTAVLRPRRTSDRVDAWSFALRANLQEPVGCTSAATAMCPVALGRPIYAAARRRAGVEELRAETHVKETRQNKTWPRQAKPCIAAAPNLNCR